MRINVGDYQVQLNDDFRFKSALVLKLVRQGNTLLDTLDAHAKALFLAENPLSRKVISRSPNCLNQLNLDYAQVVITNFRKLFRLINSLMEEKSNKGVDG